MTTYTYYVAKLADKDSSRFIVSESSDELHAKIRSKVKVFEDVVGIFIVTISRKLQSFFLDCDRLGSYLLDGYDGIDRTFVKYTIISRVTIFQNHNCIPFN